MAAPPLIDAEFEVLSDGRPERRLTTWTFWDDDFPQICGILGGVAAMAFLSWLFGATHWFG